MRVKIILDEIFCEALIVRQAVEIRIESTLICCHKGEKLWVDQFFLDVNCDFVGEDLLQIAIDRICILIERKQHLGFDVVKLSVVNSGGELVLYGLLR